MKVKRKHCANCQYHNIQSIPFCEFGYVYKCLKHNFNIGNPELYICDNFILKEDSKIKKQCNFRKIKIWQEEK